MTTATANATFSERFGRAPDVVIRAPGRINLIGDHVDYNDGLVLPMAINRSTDVAARRTDTGVIEAYSTANDQTVIISLTEERIEPKQHWSNYLVGVAATLKRQRVDLTGAQLWIGGDLPPGAGLASSAALEVGVAKALLELAARKMSPVALATMCRAAEQEFAGSPCGVMDQLCCTSAQENHALLLDCRSMKIEHIAMNLLDAQFVVLDTGVRHNIAQSEYVTRRRECATALDSLREMHPFIRSLRDLGLHDLPTIGERLDETLTRRVRHVVTEITRVGEAVTALRENDAVSFGWLMKDSHESLRVDYEVSCAELDAMVSLAHDVDGVYGARMTGGGFGGCAVALVSKDAVVSLKEKIIHLYNGPFEREAGVYPVQSAACVSVINDND